MTTTPAAPAAELEPAAWMYTRKNATYPNIGLHSKVSKGRWMPVPTDWTETPLYTADQLHALIEERDRLREEEEVERLRLHSYTTFTDGLEAGAQICGSMAETVFDDADGFAAATGCEAEIMRVVRDQRREQARAALAGEQP